MRKLFPFLLLLAIAVPTFAKDVPFQVVSWPDSGPTVLRFSFSKFKGLESSMGKQRFYSTDVVAENLSGKTIPVANFSLYVFDKTQARIGDALIHLDNVGAGQTVKFQVSLQASGTPASLAIAAASAAPRSISITINSVPQGASFTLDGKTEGTTPKIIEVTVGKHMLEFSKEGYNSGKFPLEMGPRDTSGGSVSYELGTSSHDTIELRDGSLLSGDLIAISGMEVQIRIGGNTQTLNRNQIKRILLTPRDTPQ